MGRVRSLHNLGEINMKNFKYSGQSFKYVVPAAGVASGDPVVQGELCGCSVVDGVENDVVEVQRTGIVRVKKNETVAFSQGDSVYFDAAEARMCNSTDGTNTLFGYAYESALAADEYMLVALKAGAAAFNGL